MLSPKALAFRVEELLKNTTVHRRKTVLVTPERQRSAKTAHSVQLGISANSEDSKSKNEDPESSSVSKESKRILNKNQIPLGRIKCKPYNPYCEECLVEQNEHSVCSLSKILPSTSSEIKKGLKRPLHTGDSDINEYEKLPKCIKLTANERETSKKRETVSNSYSETNDELRGPDFRSFENKLASSGFQFGGNPMPVTQNGAERVPNDSPLDNYQRWNPGGVYQPPNYQLQIRNGNFLFPNIFKNTENSYLNFNEFKVKRDAKEDCSRFVVQNGVAVTLLHHSLWSEFHRNQTEMIITKNGRRMFPVIKIRVQGLDPDSMYMMYLDIKPLDGKRYRYAYQSSTWVVAGTGDPGTQEQAYIHPDSPATGRRWMEMLAINFDKLKLTNNKTREVKGQVFLHSMQKYVPRIWIQRLEPSKGSQRPLADSHPPPSNHHDIHNLHKCTENFPKLCFSFPETTFITVTAYQNQKITRLKINSNPFAKGFRDNAKYKETIEKDLRSAVFGGVNNHNLHQFPFTNWPPLPPPSFIPPPFPFGPILPFPPPHLMPSGSQSTSRWSSSNPAGKSGGVNVLREPHPLSNRSIYELENESFIMDLTKKKKDKGK